MKYIIYILLACLIFASCLANNKDTELAIASCEKYYGYMKAKKVDSVVNLCSKDFFAETDTAQLLGGLNIIQQNHGNVIFSELVRTETKKSNGKHKIELIFRVVYSSGYVAQETFRFYSGIGYTGKIDGFRTVKWKDESKTD